MGNDDQLRRIAEALERISPSPGPEPDLSAADVFAWRSVPGRLDPVTEVNRVDLSLLVGIDRAKSILMENTRNFAAGRVANNALLWGARGMGKSSLVKAVHARISSQAEGIKLVEIQREDISSLSALLGILRSSSARFILFCDDLSFAYDDFHYKSLKAVLDGGVEGRPGNVVLYATSNRRHLMPRDMIENERSTAINPSEAADEKISLSDRFGLWLGFHPCSQSEYLEMVRGYCSHAGLEVTGDELVGGAIEWQQTRGARSGRVAWQYFLHLAGSRPDGRAASAAPDIGHG